MVRPRSRCAGPNGAAAERDDRRHTPGVTEYDLRTDYRAHWRHAQPRDRHPARSNRWRNPRCPNARAGPELPRPASHRHHDGLSKPHRRRDRTPAIVPVCAGICLRFYQPRPVRNRHSNARSPSQALPGDARLLQCRFRSWRLSRQRPSSPARPRMANGFAFPAACADVVLTAHRSLRRALDEPRPAARLHHGPRRFSAPACVQARFLRAARGAVRVSSQTRV